MIKIIKIITLSAITLLMNSCLLKTIKPTDPCSNTQLSIDLSRYTKAELAQLEKSLLRSSDGSRLQVACRQAVLARLYLDQGNTTKSSNFYSRAAEELPELSDYFMLAKAKAEFKGGHFIQAKTIAQALLNSPAESLPAGIASRIKHILAEIAVKEQDHQQVVESHQELLKDNIGVNESLLKNLASSLKHIGHHQRADEIYKQLLIRYPRVEEKKLELELPENEQRFKRLIAKLAFDYVVKEADQAIHHQKTTQQEASVYHGLAIKSLILNNKFQVGLKRASKQALSNNALPKDLENYAWSLGKVDRFLEAADFYSRFAARTSDANERARGCFFAGFSLYEAGFYTMAQYSWQGCKSSMEKSSWHESYLWYLALSSMLSNSFDQAHQILKSLVQEFPNSAESEKYSFFLGFSLRQQYKKNAGDTYLRKLANKNQPSYYVMLARQTLGLTKAKAPRLAADALSQLANRCHKPACEKVMKLYHLGFSEEARDLVLSLNIDSEIKLAMLQHIGYYHDAWQRSYTIKAQLEANHIKNDPKLRASYPLPHQSIIDDMSRKYNIKKSLLYAIIQAESGFLSDAESYRGALGLMQMMPFVANDLANRLNLVEFSSQHLKEPSIAIELGSLFLATLKRQFDNIHLVVAAYNAGPHQVQKWHNSFGHLPIELFIERIPFEQTRNYVKKVLPSESLYFALQGQDLSLTF